MTLPQNIIDCMSPEDRKQYGLSVGKQSAAWTSTEAREHAIRKDERQLQNQIGNYLRMLGLWYGQDRMDRKKSGTVGEPDFRFPYRGRYVAWECKCAWSKKLRPEQETARQAITAQGGEWRMISTLQEAQAHLREIKREED